MSLPLSIKLSGVSTAIPLLANGVSGKFSVQAVTVDEPEGNRLWQQIKTKIVTTHAMTRDDGGDVQAGFPLFITYPLGQKDDLTTPPEWSLKNFVLFIDAVLGTADEGNKAGKPTRPNFDADLIPHLLGKEFWGKIGIKKSKDDSYGDSNVFKQMLNLADVKA